MKENRLLDELTIYSKSGAVPMHMPGHKRNVDVADYLKVLNAKLDITEIDGFDNLHNPTGILKCAMDKAATLYKSSNTYFLINGSTCGILAGMKACLKHGDEIIMARNCHKSVYHGVELLGLTPYFLYPEKIEGICGQISPVELEELIQAHKNVKLVIITSPTYEGIISDIEELAKVAHKYSLPLMVDAAHGAHMGFNEYFGPSAVEAGADIVINSLHKTMPSLTQTALAHVNGKLVDASEYARCLSIFETSSPSYLLMASIDGCINLVMDKGEKLFAAYENRVRSFYENVKGLKNLRVMGVGEEANLDCQYRKDPGKIVVFTNGLEISGVCLSEVLRKEYNIEVEMAANNYIIAMTGLIDSDENLVKMAAALNEIDSGRERLEKTICGNEVGDEVGDKGLEYRFTVIDRCFDKTASDYPCKIEDAIGMPKETVACSDAIGNISGEYVWAYPPGIPILIPGQIIKEEDVKGIREMIANGVSVCRG